MLIVVCVHSPNKSGYEGALTSYYTHRLGRYERTVEFLHMFPTETGNTADDFRFPSSVRQVAEPTFPTGSSRLLRTLSFCRHYLPPSLSQR